MFCNIKCENIKSQMWNYILISINDSQLSENKSESLKSARGTSHSLMQILISYV